MHSSLFRHSSLGFRHFGSEDTLKPDDPFSSLEIKTLLIVKGMFRPMRAIRFGSLLTVVLMIGCSQNNPTKENQAKKSTPEEINLEVASWKSLQKRIADHKGKVVVLDVWSTACAPCIKELPGLSKLQQKHQLFLQSDPQGMEKLEIKD